MKRYRYVQSKPSANRLFKTDGGVLEHVLFKTKVALCRKICRSDRGRCVGAEHWGVNHLGDIKAPPD